MEIKVINNVWYHIDDAHPNGLNWSDWDCQFDTDANTFVLIFPNNSSFPKKAIPSLDITVTASGVSNSYPTVALLRARLLQLNYPPLVGGAIAVLPDGIEINKGVLNPTTTTITAPTNTETHFYRIIENGTVNGTLAVKVGDIVGINSTSLWLGSNNNQKPNEKIYISTAVYNMLPVLTAQKILDTSVSADGYIPVLANKHYEFKLRCHVTELSLSNNYLTFLMANSGVIATDFRYSSNSSKNSNAVTPTPEMRLIHNGGTGYGAQNALSVNSPSRPDMFIDIEGHFRTVTDGNIAPMLQININAAAAKIQPGLYFSIKEITLNN
jgi:hypothetical protein